jgi:hypothetical protein
MARRLKLEFVAGLNPTSSGLALAMVVAAVLLNVIPHVFSWLRSRGKTRKEAMRMNSYSVKSVVLTASTSVGSALMTNIAATAVVPG